MILKMTDKIVRIFIFLATEIDHKIFTVHTQIPDSKSQTNSFVQGCTQRGEGVLGVRTTPRN